MLKTLSIDRFKSIRKCELNLSNINIFIGGNGSGKSNVLEAIGVMSAALDRGLGDSDLSRKGVRITPPELMKSAFKNVDLPKTLQLAGSLEKDITYRVNLRGKQDAPLLAFHSEYCSRGESRIFGRSPHGATVFGKSIFGHLSKHRSIWDQVRNAFDFPIEVQEVLDGLSGYAIYSPQTAVLRGMQQGQVDTPPIGLHGAGLPEAVRGLIQQLLVAGRPSQKKRSPATYELKDKAFGLVWLPQWTNRVKVGAIEKYLTSRESLSSGEDMVYFVDKFMHKKRRSLSANDSSEGTLYLLFAAVLLSHNDSPKMFALDNVDSALNPHMTRSLLETIIGAVESATDEDLGCGPRQVFLTSHHPTSLDAFDLFSKRQRVFVVERNDEGHTEVTPLTPREGMSKEEWYEAKGGKNLSQLWLDGEISGALGKPV